MTTPSPHHSPERVLGALPGGLLAFDAVTGRIWFANPRAGALLERAPGQLVGDTIDAAFSPLEWLEANRRLPQPDRRRAIPLPSGAQLIAGFTLVDLEDGDRSSVLYFQDIGPWEQLRVERNRLLQLATVGSALPAMLHELKNPLAAVTTTVEVLLEEVPGGPVQEQLHAVLSELRRLRLTIDGVGAVGQGLRTQRHAPVDLACREAWSIMEARGLQAGVRCRCRVADMPLLPLDPSVIRAIVYNLVSNAIQACEPNDTVNLYVHLVDGGKVLELIVVDDGAGMSAETYRRCTELFFTTRRNGSGIGLALVRSAVEEAGGQLSVESVPGFGTSVTARVPVTTAGPMGD